MVKTVIRKYRAVAAGAAVLGASLMMMGSTGQTPVAAVGPPFPSAAALLKNGGIVATPLGPSAGSGQLAETEPISEHQALKAVGAWFAPISGPVRGELVLFTQKGTPGLDKPQPAWLFTWHFVLDPLLGPAAKGPIVPWHQMNAAVSAVTGKVLEEFPSNR